MSFDELFGFMQPKRKRLLNITRYEKVTYCKDGFRSVWHAYLSLTELGTEINATELIEFKDRNVKLYLN